MSYFSKIASIWASLRTNRGLGTLTVLEGMPGSGKTTTGRMLAKCHGFMMVNELDHLSYPGFTPTALGDCDRWYISSEIEKQHQLSHTLKRGESVIQDRGLLSNLAFTYANLSRLDRQDEYDSYLDAVAGSVAGRVLMPNLLVFLSISVSLSVARRVNDDPRYAIWFDHRFLQSYETFYHIVSDCITACPTMTIDTSFVSKKDVSMIIIEALRTNAGIHPSVRDRQL